MIFGLEIVAYRSCYHQLGNKIEGQITLSKSIQNYLIHVFPCSSYIGYFLHVNNAENKERTVWRSAAKYLVYLLQTSKRRCSICIRNTVHFDVLKNTFMVFIKLVILSSESKQRCSTFWCTEGSVQILHYKLLLISSLFSLLRNI